jgi:hypothetical protein
LESLWPFDKFNILNVLSKACMMPLAHSHSCHPVPIYFPNPLSSSPHPQIVNHPYKMSLPIQKVSDNLLHQI